MIEMVVNLLKHKNPCTGRTYADEPALCFIELQNEDDIFFYTSEHILDSCPTYKKRFLERFVGWLKDRYGSQEKLQTAWGDALFAQGNAGGGERRGTICRLNPWFFSEDHLAGGRRAARRGSDLLDTAAFLHDVQDRFYSRFVKAIREAGYKGPLNGSPWQAPSMLPHYYNLNSDYKVGYIDRHNYFDGAGKEMFASMLTHPGSGYFGSGLQQVIDRPFGLSEWIHVYPNVYIRRKALLSWRPTAWACKAGTLPMSSSPRPTAGPSTTSPAAFPGAFGRPTRPRHWASSPRWRG